MYARIVSAHFQPGTFNEAVELFRNSAMPEIRQQHGFKGVLLLSDAGTDKGITITLWETESDAQATGVGSAHLQAQLAKVASRFASAPVTETCEVIFQE